MHILHFEKKKITSIWIKIISKGGLIHKQDNNWKKKAVLHFSVSFHYTLTFDKYCNQISNPRTQQQLHSTISIKIVLGNNVLIIRSNSHLRYYLYFRSYSYSGIRSYSYSYIRSKSYGPKNHPPFKRPWERPWVRLTAGVNESIAVKCCSIKCWTRNH